MDLKKSDLQLETVISRISQDELDLQPNFQRGEVWDLKRRQRLIDTVLRNWYVPAVHIVIESDGREVVLDGQQRLAAIRDFAKGLFRVDGKTEPRSDSIMELDGLRYQQLPDTVRRSFNRFVLQVITLTDYRPQEPNELFFRLNQSYNLTPPEKRNALHGEARDQVKSLVAELADDGLLTKERVGFSNGRLAYDDIIARTCVSIAHQTMRQHINNNVVESFYRTRAFAPEVMEGVRRSADELRAQIDNVGTGVKFNKGTLQTWLTYCYWAPALTGPLPDELLDVFEQTRNASKAGELVDGDPQARISRMLVEIYEDRASYRVTDVSSVLARDLSVHLFSLVNFGSTAIPQSSGLLQEIIDSEGRSAGVQVFHLLDEDGWDPLRTLVIKS